MIAGTDAAPSVSARVREFACVLLLVAIAGTWAHHTQAYRLNRLWDADEYYKLTEQLAAHTTVTAEAPYAFRVLTPWIVARCCASDITGGFLAVNVIAGVLTALLLVIWLRRFVDDWRIRVAVVAAYAFEWHAPVRYVYYNPVYTDPLFIAALLLGMIFVDRAARSSRWIDISALTLITLLGTLAREVMLLVPVCALFHPALGRGRERAIASLRLLGPLAAAFVALVFARYGTATRGDYSFASAALYHLTHKPVFSALLAWFLTFGTAIVVIVFDWRDAGRFLARNAHLGVFLAACAVLAYFGGHDTERYLIWSMPVVYGLLARAIWRNRAVLDSAWLIATLGWAQAISARVFWAIPNPEARVASLDELPGRASKLYAILNRLFVIDDFHWNLWSNFGSRPFHVALLAIYVAFCAAVLVWMQSRAAQRHAAHA